MLVTALRQFRVGSAVAGAIPRALLTISARGAGRVGVRADSAGVEMLERHLARVDPGLSPAETRRAARAGMASYARYWIETLRMGSLSDAAIESGFRADGYDPHIVDALAAGRGVILALPHLGGWEWAGRWLAQRGHRVTAVVERLDPPEVYEWFVSMRQRAGIDVVPIGPDTSTRLLAALRRNDVVALMCDRDLDRNGIEVEFFGEQTTLPAGPVLLSMRSGAPVLPTAVYFTDRPDGHLAVVEPPLPIRRSDRGIRSDLAIATQLLADRVESLIRRAPEQWHLLQPNWPSDPGYGDPGYGDEGDSDPGYDEAPSRR